MNSFDQETLALIPGETPKQKNETLRFLLKIANEIASPRRGTPEETRTLEDFALSISLQLRPNPIVDHLETINSDWSLESCFHKLRIDPAHHLGFGDIRLSMSEQEDICHLVKVREVHNRLKSKK